MSNHKSWYHMGSVKKDFIGSKNSHQKPCNGGSRISRRGRRPRRRWCQLLMWLRFEKFCTPKQRNCDHSEGVCRGHPPALGSANAFLPDLQAELRHINTLFESLNDGQSSTSWSLSPGHSPLVANVKCLIVTYVPCKNPDVN